MISYEEYYPYGSSAYRAAASGVDLSLKRYRFTEKEWDGETGLDYFGVRYYASWLGRWTSGDPGGFVDGLNMYRYALNNPVNGIDREGYSTEAVQDDTNPPENGIPVVVDGKVVRYIVGEGQGFTHVAAHLNDPKTQEEFGYILDEPIDWKDIAFEWDNFVKYSLAEFTRNNISLEDAGDPYHEAWRSLNMNEGDLLKIVTKHPEEIIEPDEEVQEPEDPAISPLAGTTYSSVIGGASGGGGNGFVSGSADLYGTTIPRNSPFWEGGLSIVIAGVAVGGGSAGFSGSTGAGQLTLTYDGVNSSALDILNEPAVTATGGLALIIGARTFYTQSLEGGYSMWQLHFMMGGKIDASLTTGLFGTIRVPEFDSLQRAREVQELLGVGVNPEMDQFIIDRMNP